MFKLENSANGISINEDTNNQMNTADAAEKQQESENSAECQESEKDLTAENSIVDDKC